MDEENEQAKELGLSCSIGLCNLLVSLTSFIGSGLLVFDNIPEFETHAKVLLSIFVMLQVFFIIFECGCICGKVDDAFLCVKAAQFLFYLLFVIVSIFMLIFGKMNLGWKFFVGDGLVIVGTFLSCCSCAAVLSRRGEARDLRLSAPVFQILQINQYHDAVQRQEAQNQQSSVIVEEITEEEEQQNLITTNDPQNIDENY